MASRITIRIRALVRQVAQRRFSCGGSEVVQWRNWSELKAMVDYEALNKTLPPRQPLLPALADHVKRSVCFNHTVYKCVALAFTLPYNICNSERGASSHRHYSLQ